MSESTLVGTSSSTRTLDERDLASLRPAKANTPRPRKAAEKRTVTRGIVCEICGAHFSEDQALEFQKHLRAEVGEVLERMARQRSRSAAYEARPEVRERRRAYARRRYQRPEVRSAILKYARERWQDPAFRARRLEYSSRPEVREREREKDRLKKRQRYADDPDFRERKREKSRNYQRERRARKKAEREAGAAPAVAPDLRT